MNAMPNWTSSPPVPFVPRPPKPERKPVDLSTPALQQLQSALDAIPQETKPLDYDDWFRVVCALHYATEGSEDGLSLAHDFSARSSKYDAEFLDSRVWCYLGVNSAEPVTPQSLFALAASHGWQDPTLIDDFDVIEAEPEDDFEALPPDTEADKAKNRFQVLTEDQFLDAPPVAWMIKGVLPHAELGVMYGESGSGKTFMVLDMAAAVARGVEWRGKRVKQGRVVYVAAEGAAGVRNRMKAYRHQHDISTTGIKVIASAPNLLEKQDAIDVSKSILAAGGADLVIIDTLAQSMPGGNENSGEDMGRVLAHGKGIHRATGAMVLFIHHSGKDSSKGARGWSGLRAACDVEMEVARADEDRVLSVTKMKDSEDGGEFGFKLETVLLAMDDDGDEVTSCVVMHGQVARKVRLKGANQRLAVDVYDELVGLSAEDGGVDREDWIVALAGQMERGDGAKDRRRELATKAIESVISLGLFEARGSKLGKVDL